MKISEDEIDQATHDMLVSLLVQTNARFDAVEALAANNTWVDFKTPDGTRWRYVCYRFDFGCNPERFRLLMEQKMIIALPCPTRDGDPLIHKGPIVSYRNKNGEYLCFYVGEEVMDSK